MKKQTCKLATAPQRVEEERARRCAVDRLTRRGRCPGLWLRALAIPCLALGLTAHIAFAVSYGGQPKEDWFWSLDLDESFNLRSSICPKPAVRYEYWSDMSIISVVRGVYYGDPTYWHYWPGATFVANKDGNWHTYSFTYAEGSGEVKYVWKFQYRWTGTGMEYRPGGPPEPTCPLRPSCHIETKDPINIVSGNMVSDTTDIAIPAPGVSMVLGRSYNSGINYTNGPLGARWCHSFD